MPLTVDLQVPYVEQAQILLDGDASDPGWADAVPLPPMTVFQPHPGDAPTGRTEAWMVADAMCLYLLFEVTDPEPERVRASLGRRDTRFSDDFVGVYLDAAGAGERTYLLLANPLGVQMDGIRTASGNDDIAWDGRWDAHGTRTDTGYRVEMAIPWSTVRHPRELKTLGLLTLRQVARTAEKSSWPALDPSVQGVMTQQAMLQGPGVLPPSGGVDVLPELTFGWTEEGPVQRTIGAAGLSPGLTVRWRPSPDVALLATANPDFSQVESDAAQVSVNRRFALFFEEKRPFFVDGSEWFTHPFGDLVYTRSMVSPLGGARATIEGDGWTTAALSVLDERPAPSVSEGGGWTEADLDGHAAVDTVARARVQLGDGYIGLLASDKTVLDSTLANRVLAVDGQTRVGTGATLQAAVAGSSTSFADDRTAMAPAASARLEGDTGSVYAGSRLQATAPDFRAENGFVVNADRAGGGSWAGGTWRPDSPVIPQIWFTPLSVRYDWRTTGERRVLGIEPNASARLGNGGQVGAGGVLFGEEFAGAWLPNRQVWAGVGADWTRWLEASIEASGGVAPIYDDVDPRSGRVLSGSAAVGLRPFPALALTTSVGGERMVEDAGLVYEGAITRARAEVFLSKQLWLRSIGNLSTFDDRQSVEVLGAWEDGPGRGIYLGGQTARSEAEGVTWGAFSKVAWTL